METARYLVAVLLVVWVPPAIVWWFVVHPFVGFWRRFGARTTLFVVGVAMLGCSAALFTVRGRLVGPDLGASPGLVALAAALLVATVSMSLWRRRYLTMRILSGIPELEGDSSTLLTEGPYARVRHPRYIEVALGIFAYAAFANHGGGWVVAALTLPALHAIVVLEERELALRFGTAWDGYRERVPRYLPRLPLSPTPRS